MTEDIESSGAKLCSDHCETCGIGYYLPSSRCDHCDTVSLEQQYQTAIEITRQGNAILSECGDPDSSAIAQREKIVMDLQGKLNMLRGFDSIAMGC